VGEKWTSTSRTHTAQKGSKQVDGCMIITAQSRKEEAPNARLRARWPIRDGVVSAERERSKGEGVLHAA
jgi:hypothetical protein